MITMKSIDTGTFSNARVLPTLIWTAHIYGYRCKNHTPALNVNISTFICVLAAETPDLLRSGSTSCDFRNHFYIYPIFGCIRNNATGKRRRMKEDEGGRSTTKILDTGTFQMHLGFSFRRVTSDPCQTEHIRDRCKE